MKYHFSSMEPWWKREFSFCIPAISIKMASISLFQNSWLKMKHLPSCLFTQTTNTLGIYRKKKPNHSRDNPRINSNLSTNYAQAKSVERSRSNSLNSGPNPLENATQRTIGHINFYIPPDETNAVTRNQAAQTNASQAVNFEGVDSNPSLIPEMLQIT